MARDGTPRKGFTGEDDSRLRTRDAAAVTTVLTPGAAGLVFERDIIPSAELGRDKIRRTIRIRPRPANRTRRKTTDALARTKSVSVHIDEPLRANPARAIRCLGAVLPIGEAAAALGEALGVRAIADATQALETEAAVADGCGTTCLALPYGGQLARVVDALEVTGAIDGTSYALLSGADGRKYAAPARVADLAVRRTVAFTATGLAALVEQAGAAA